MVAISSTVATSCLAASMSTFCLFRAASLFGLPEGGVDVWVLLQVGRVEVVVPEDVQLLLAQVSVLLLNSYVAGTWCWRRLRGCRPPPGPESAAPSSAPSGRLSWPGWDHRYRRGMSQWAYATSAGSTRLIAANKLRATFMNSSRNQVGRGIVRLVF